jgi:tol-pal system protein YbgF
MTMKSAIARSFAFAFALSLAAGSAQAQNWFGQRNNEDSDLTVRVQELERQVRELTGKNEELQHQNDVLTQQLNASRGGPPQGQYSSQPPMTRAQGAPPPSGPMGSPGMTQGSMTNPPLAEPRGDDRYGQQQYGGPPPAQPQYGGPPQAQPRYEDGGYGGPPPAQPGYGQQPYENSPASEASARPSGRGDAFDPALHPNAPGAPRPLGAPLDMNAVAHGMPQSAPPPNPRGPEGQLAVLPPSSSPKDEYDLAYGYILRRDYALADQAFRVFLRSHPDDRLVPDATYWLGESLYQRKQFDDAASTFLDVYNKYPKSAKAPEALLRLGQSLAATGQQEAACASLGAVLEKYPKASPSVKNQVAAEQKRAHC